jgi:dolichyl-phosphate-mannose-protein mannosyltransferase
MDFSFLKGETAYVVYALLASLIARISLFPVQGCLGDLWLFAEWFNSAAQHGPFVFYQVTRTCDYPPFNVYIFWTFGSLARSLSLFGKPAINYVLKLPSTLFDTATAGLIFVFLRKRLSFDSSLIATSFYAFNPATIFNGSIWGQFDAIYTFFLILSLMFILESKPKLSAGAFTIAVLAKPQSIALAPLIVFLILKRRSWKTAAASVLTSAAAIFIVSAPLSLNNLADFLVNIYLKGYQTYRVTSANAFNLWALSGFWKSDAQTFLSLDLFKIGWILFGALTAFSLYYLHRASNATQNNSRSFEMSVFFTAFVLLFGFFMLPTRIHERYLFPVLSVLTLMLPFVKETRPLFAVLTFTYLFNMAYVLGFLNTNSYIPDGDPFVYVITSINLAAFVYTLVVMVRKPKWEATSFLSKARERLKNLTVTECEPRC